MSSVRTVDISVNKRINYRSTVLRSLGATLSEKNELLKYNENIFDHSSLTPHFTLPFRDSPSISVWRDYQSSGTDKSIFEALKKPLVQLSFPIQKGISRKEYYTSATLRGIHPNKIVQATGLKLKEPNGLNLSIHHTLAGHVPIISTTVRDDFVVLVQAITEKNEPVPIPASMGGVTVIGYNNWDRIYNYRTKWEAESNYDFTGDGWKKEFKYLVSQKDLYQDNFIILSSGNYSNIPAFSFGLPEDRWKYLSTIIRKEHECTHYFTRHILSSARNRLLDELIADYMGITAVEKHFRSNWFLYFMGLDNFPQYKRGGRLENYLGTPPLSNGSFKILCKLAKYAAENMENIDNIFRPGTDNRYKRTDILLALTYLTIEELASHDAVLLFQKALKRTESVLAE
jgi:hypothetical protein